MALKKSLTTVSWFQKNKLCVFNKFGNYFEDFFFKLVNTRMCNGKWSLVVFDFLRKLILKTSGLGLSWFHMVVFIEKCTVARHVG